MRDQKRKQESFNRREYAQTLNKNYHNLRAFGDSHTS